MTVQPFDVFLAHSSKDKLLIRQLYLQLKRHGIRPWLDEEEIAPGSSFQEEIQQAICKVNTAAICIGGEGLGQWQGLELQTLVSECITRGVRVIPLLLPGVTEIPSRLIFLKQYQFVAFSDVADEQALFRLTWGITQKKPVYGSVESETGTNLSKQFNTKVERDIEKLENFLSSAEWKKADKQTTTLILGHNANSRLMASAIRQLSLDTLGIVDRLWTQYSDGRFGLKIQRQLWQQCLEPRKSWNPFAQAVSVTDTEAWNQLGLTVGWRDEEKKVLPDSKITFSIEAPSGCFPQTRRWLHGGYGNAVKQFRVLMERVSELE